MPETLDTWARSVEHRLIDRDRAYGAQCWDLAADYAERVAGCPLAEFWTMWNPASPDHTLASSMWLHWPVKPGITHHFTRHGRHEQIQAGDIPIWGRSRAYPASHIAVALGPAGAKGIPCMTQNPGAATRATLTASGLLGFLRPITAKTNTTVRKDTRMHAVRQIGLPDSGIIIGAGQAPRARHESVFIAECNALGITPVDVPDWQYGTVVREAWTDFSTTAGIIADAVAGKLPKGAPTAPLGISDADAQRIAEAVANEHAERLKK